MNITNNKNSDLITYTGIKLSNDNFNQVRSIVTALKFKGINCAGHKTFYTGTSFNDKSSITNYIRNHYIFDKDEYGVVFLPNSHEAYILAQPKFERKLLKSV